MTYLARLMQETGLTLGTGGPPASEPVVLSGGLPHAVSTGARLQVVDVEAESPAAAVSSAAAGVSNAFSPAAGPDAAVHAVTSATARSSSPTEVLRESAAAAPEPDPPVLEIVATRPDPSASPLRPAAATFEDPTPLRPSSATEERPRPTARPSLVEVRQWVAATGEADEPGVPAFGEGHVVGAVQPSPRSQFPIEEFHLSIGAIHVTVEEPAAAPPSPALPPVRPEPPVVNAGDATRLARHYLR